MTIFRTIKSKLGQAAETLHYRRCRNYNCSRCWCYWLVNDPHSQRIRA